MSAIIDYLFRHPQDYLENINELTQQTQLLDEINRVNQHLYK
jgi:hypothetical protein